MALCNKFWWPKTGSYHSFIKILELVQVKASQVDTCCYNGCVSNWPINSIKLHQMLKIGFFCGIGSDSSEIVQPTSTVVLSWSIFLSSMHLGSDHCSAEMQCCPVQLPSSHSSIKSCTLSAKNSFYIRYHISKKFEQTKIYQDEPVHFRLPLYHFLLCLLYASSHSRS